MALHRNEDGTFPAFAWPGGYPVIYITDDSAVLCPDCANGKNGSEASETAERRSGWRLVAADVYYEGPDMCCDHCNTMIESAYGDPDAEDESADS